MYCWFSSNGDHKVLFFGRCLKNNVCFAGVAKTSAFMSRDADLCKADLSCPKPINTTNLSKHCNRSMLVAMKVIYLCNLESLLTLIDDDNLNLKIVHLVRDPRATTDSRARAEGKSYK